MIDKPFSFDELDPNGDLVKATSFAEDSDDVEVTELFSDFGGIQPGEVWYIHATVTASDELQNEGIIAVSDEDFNPDGTESFLMERVKDGSEGMNALEGYLTYDETGGNSIYVVSYFPDASFDAYSWLFLRAEAVKMRRGHDLSPTAFSPNQPVQTFDGTEQADASFTAASIYEPGFGRLDLDDDNRHDAVTYTAEIPEYTDADNPILGFEVRRLDTVDSDETDWPTDWQELDAAGALPQSDNVDSSDWPIYATISENEEVPTPYQDFDSNEVARTYYEVRPNLWEANQKQLTETKGNVYEFSLADGG